MAPYESQGVETMKYYLMMIEVEDDKLTIETGTQFVNFMAQMKIGKSKLYEVKNPDEYHRVQKEMNKNAS